MQIKPLLLLLLLLGGARQGGGNPAANTKCQVGSARLGSGSFHIAVEQWSRPGCLRRAEIYTRARADECASLTTVIQVSLSVRAMRSLRAQATQCCVCRQLSAPRALHERPSLPLGGTQHRHQIATAAILAGNSVHHAICTLVKLDTPVKSTAVDSHSRQILAPAKLCSLLLSFPSLGSCVQTRRVPVELEIRV